MKCTDADDGGRELECATETEKKRETNGKRNFKRIKKEKKELERNRIYC